MIVLALEERGRDGGATGNLDVNYTGQEGMRKTKFCLELSPGLMTSKPAH